MSWKWFVPPLAAALLLGRPVRAPKLAPALPTTDDSRCDQGSAVHAYLLAYAYAANFPGTAGKFLAAAEAERSRCADDTRELAARIRELKSALP